MTLALVPETGFAVLYDGPALQDGRMEVRELAPALIAFGDLFREANAVINPDSPPISLQIRATAEGSFVVELILVQPDLIQQIVDFLTSDQVNALINLREMVIAGGGGLFWLIQTVRKRRIASQREQRGSVELTFSDGTQITVPAGVLSLYRNARIRKRAREVVEPLSHEGIDKVAFRRESEEEVTVEVGVEDLDSFDPPAVEAEALLETDTEMAVTIANVAFQEGNKWRLSDGDRTFFASIDDSRFLARVDQAEEAFRKGDILRCRMHIEQVRDDTGLHTNWYVTRVLEHIPATRAIQLTINGGDDELAAGS